MCRREEAFIIKEGNNLIKGYEINMKYKQQTTYELIDNLYDWLISVAVKDFNQLKVNNCEDYYTEYKQIKKELLIKRQAIKNNAKINMLNFDSFERLKTIIEATKEEYKAMADADEKDMVYFNNLLGWYEAIPSETDMFIDSLFEKQEVVDYVAMCEKPSYVVRKINNINFGSENVYIPEINLGFPIEDCEAYQEIAMTV